VYHEVRIHFKISRYALNFIQEMQIAKVSKQIKLAKKYQGALGEIQDVSQQIVLLQKICKNKNIKECQSVIDSFQRRLIKLKQERNTNILCLS
ncbi:MAG: CHAD domain-containing protein, partial [Campylobacterota bacterium]|nr:CHAD domain-containing protein [Campylobacterota bacterium]